MGVMIIVILLAFLTVVAVIYVGSQGAHEGEQNYSAANSAAVTAWTERANRVNPPAATERPTAPQPTEEENETLEKEMPEAEMPRDEVLEEDKTTS